jgi:hypothetical protein
VSLWTLFLTVGFTKPVLITISSIINNDYFHCTPIDGVYE